MIDFMEVMLAVVAEYKQTSQTVYVWIDMGSTPQKWAISTNRDATEEPPTFFFGGRIFEVEES